MNSQEIKECLKALIDNTLKPLINSDYVLWDLPYHINMGDILIWQGELDFLSNLPYNMLDFGSSQTVNFPKLSKETTILLHGGGNFGDIYRSSQLFRNEVIKRYPENKIIILPQTVYYKNDSILKEDMNIMSKHSNLYVCVRDSYSKNLLSIYLDNKRVFLLPDMAFCMDDHYFSNNKGLGKVLYMKRLDAEFKANGTSLDIKYDLMSDWPSFEGEDLITRKLRYYNLFQLFNKRLKKYIGINFAKTIDNKMNHYCHSVVRKHLISGAINFLNDYDQIYTTRMHGCILGVLLNKNIFLLDNIYGKNIQFYEEWLKPYNKITVFQAENEAKE